VSLPAPRPGLIIRYDYLWSREAAEGQDYGKERPACLVATLDSVDRPLHVVLLPITHTAPTGETIGIEIPLPVKAALNLDSDRSWVIISEYNIDNWPNGGLSSISGSTDKFSYGFLPPTLFAQIKNAFLDLARNRSAQSVQRR
jgi:hypothetical protein